MMFYIVAETKKRPEAAFLLFDLGGYSFVQE